MKTTRIVLAVILGILFLVCAVVYAINPATSLPHFLPGYTAGLMKHHYTHAAVSFVLGVLSFLFAWFQTGKKSPQEKQA